MKESGIDWIGQIPEEWEVAKVNHIFEEHKQKNRGNKEKNLLSLSYGRIIRKSIDSSFGLLPESFDTYNIIQRGDIVLRLTDLQNDKRSLRVGLARENGIITSAYLTLRLKNLESNDSYMYYLLHTYDICKVFYNFGGGVRQGGTWSDIYKMELLIPPCNEQQKIADFLDKKTAQLDKAKALLEEQIQKLKDYRASLIYETVTKGLDKTVPLKDSGIDWIGQVPQGWGVKPLKYLASYDDESLTQSEINSNQKINYVDIGAVEFTKGINGYQELLMSEAPSRARKIAKKGDTIISTVRTYLKAIAYLNDDYIVSTGFCVVRPKKVNSKYLNYTIMSDSFTGPVSKYAWGVSYPAISSSQLVNIPIPFPESIEEQLSIVDYLDHKMLQINQLIDIKQEQIENINKQRQTLIYDYVTGKRRV
jgi:hypothetical protein